MSLILFPQERSSENLVHVILPLALVLFVTSWLFPETPNYDWLIGSLIAVSIGSLFLYMSGVDSILVKRHYRNKIREERGTNLEGLFGKWDTYVREWHGIGNKDFVKTMIENSISSPAISRKLWRIRAFWYFIFSFWLYVLTGFQYYIRSRWYLLTIGVQLISDFIVIIGLVLAGFGFLGLFYAKDKRRFYALYLERDICYVAQFQYLRAIIVHEYLTNPNYFKKNPIFERIRNELNYLETLLIRHDMDFFANLWQNGLGQMKSLKQMISTKEYRDLQELC